MTDEIPQEVLNAEDKLRLFGQMLIVIAKRNGGRFTIPVSELNATGQDMLHMTMSTTHDGVDVFEFQHSLKS